MNTSLCFVPKNEAMFETLKLKMPKFHGTLYYPCVAMFGALVLYAVIKLNNLIYLILTNEESFYDPNLYPINRAPSGSSPM